ncbi:MAG: type VI secretion system contractile sheath large subunit [Acidobacteria bacterium]|nr:type VI secretion system contractile sheath large subunit [Acidobacteriota bacterium]MCB9398991.1 type VI secretion system contractile sheath large subunit [Acidobacteriota bacterium]
MTLNFQVDSEKPATPVEKKIRILLFGNFSGSDAERPTLAAVPLNRNQWDGLFVQFKPSIDLTLTLDNRIEIPGHLAFKSLADFQAKNVARNIPFLLQLNQLADAVGSASENQPLDVQALLPKLNLLEPLVRLAKDFKDEPALDLLNMVDLGEADEAASGWSFKWLKALLAKPSYQGHKREATVNELRTIEAELLGQVQKLPKFKALEALWRSLKEALSSCRAPLEWALVDCADHEICDAVYLVCIKPEQGEPEPVDLVVSAFQYGMSEEDLHRIYHLGRMGETLQAPVLLSAHPQLFGLNSNRMLQHYKDISGRMNGPAYAKWRKQREHSGSRWLFMAVNQFGLKSDDESQNEDTAVFGPGSLALAFVLAKELKENRWPGELLSPIGELDSFTHTESILTEQQGMDLGYEGFCAITQNRVNTAVQLLSMNSMAQVTIGLGESPSARDFVEFTLPYMFFVGCLARFLQKNGRADDAKERVKAYIGSLRDEDVVTEEADGQLLFRVKPPFSIYRIKPDIVLGVE